MTAKQNIIDWQRIHTHRELAGDWRILRAKIRHVVDRACVLAENLAYDIDDSDAIETLRVFALAYLDGREPKLPVTWLIDALEQLFDIDLDLDSAYARAA